MYGVGALLAVIGVPLRVELPESARWLVGQGRLEEAEEVVTDMELVASKHGALAVAFYELFNEPTAFFDRLGRMSWEEWKRINEDLIIMIRAYDKETIPLVSGLDWAYDLSPLRNSPIAALGIGYATHPYAQKRPQPGCRSGKRISASPPGSSP